MMKKFVVLLAAFAMVLGFTAAAMADASLYGSVRFVTTWHDTSDDYGNALADDDEDLEWQMGKLSRFGVKFKEGNITGRFEVDARAGQLGSMNIEDGSGSSYHGNIRLRHLWGAWDFGPGELCIGHRHSLFTYYATQFGSDPTAGFAAFSGSNLRYFRASQIRLTFGNLKIAFLTPDTSYKPVDFTKTDGKGSIGVEYNPAGSDTDTELPRIEAAYTWKLDPVTFDFMAGWQSFEFEDPNGDTEDVQSYVGLIKAAYNCGPFYVKGLVRYAQNGLNYGIWTNCEERAAWDGNDVEDVEALGYAIGVGYKFSDMITIEAGFAGTDSENSDLPGDPEDDVAIYGILCKITPAPGVTIQPEITFLDQEESDYKELLTGEDEQGDDLRIGVFWKIDFK